MIKRIKNLFILSFFCCFVTLMGAEKEIPHTIVTENPKKEVTEIKTLKKYKEKAELNITVTKIKAEELPVQVDERRKKIFIKLENVNGEEIQVLERAEDIPNPETIQGRRALNRLKRNISDNNLETERYNKVGGKEKTKLEVNYKNLPKDLYIAVTDKGSNKLKKLYKANYTDYKAQYNHYVKVQLWVFGDELSNLSNIILDSGLNGTGDIKLRSEGNNSRPDNAIQKSGLHTVFDMDKSLLAEEFEDSDTIEIENAVGCSNIRNNQGSFYEDRNKYGELSVPGFNVKARIWSGCDKFELSLQKSGNQDGYAHFYLKHRDSSKNLRQMIEVELFINNKPFDQYFVSTKAVFNTPYDGTPIDKWVTLNNLNLRVRDFYTDKMTVETNRTPDIEKRLGENNTITIFHQDGMIEKVEYSGFYGDYNKKISNGVISSLDFYVRKEWFQDSRYQTFKIFIARDAIQLKYGNLKRKVNCEVQVGYYTNDWKESQEICEGTIVGIPDVRYPLQEYQNNGEKVIEFKNGAKRFFISQNIENVGYARQFKILLNDGQVLGPFQQTIDRQDFILKGIKFRLKKSRQSNAYIDYDIYMEKMKLEKEDRILEIRGRSELYGGFGWQYNSIVSKIHIPKFSPQKLIDLELTSFKNKIEKTVDISDGLNDKTTEVKINLGNIYFKSFNDFTIFTQNMNTPPYIELPNRIKLTGSKGQVIMGDLSFDRYGDKKNLFLNDWGGSVYLKISGEEYQKLKQNGANITYSLEKNMAKIKANIDKTPIPNTTPIGLVEETLNYDISIKTVKVNLNEVIVEFSNQKPLIKDGWIGILNNQIEYLKGMEDTRYQNSVFLTGNLNPYTLKNRKHEVEVTDDNGHILTNIISNNGYGGYWKDLDLGNGNKGTIVQGRDEKTYISLTNWNYKGSSGMVNIKHYNERKIGIEQYYRIYFKIPAFDPYFYYNEKIGNIPKFSYIDLKVPDDLKNNKIEIGNIGTEDYNMEITKDNLDKKGLRIEGNQNLSIFDGTTNADTGKKAKIILEGIDVQNNQIVGQNKNAKVYLELPMDLPRDKNYIIKSSYPSENHIGETNLYILRIGRTGYFKELIKEIKLEAQQLPKGSATINLTSSYNLKDSAILKAPDSIFGELLSFENIVKGMSLSNQIGNGFVKLDSTDKIKIIFNGVETEILNDGSKEINLTKNKMKIEIKNNKVHISFPAVILGVESQDEFTLKVLNEVGIEKGNYIFKIVFPQNFLRITSVEDMDFKRAVPGIAGYKASGKVHIETLNTVEKRNLKVEKNQEQVELIRESNSTDKLVAKMIGETLEKEGTISDGKYIYEVVGELDVPKNTPLGSYKGTLQITVSIKE